MFQELVTSLKTDGKLSKNTQVIFYRLLPLIFYRKEVKLMGTKKELTKDERVKKEINRLKRIYRDLPKDTLQVVEGLIVEAADLRIRLEDIRKDLDENGYDEKFSQSPTQEPYERERPQSRRYIQMNKSYQTIMKQLGDYIPKKPIKNEDKDDGFETFVSERDD